MDKKRLVQLIAMNAYNAYSLSLNGTQRGGQYFDYVKKPQLGDVVCVTDYMYRPSDMLVKSVGTLVSITSEVYPDYVNNWDEVVEGRPAPTRPIYTLKLLYDESLFRWENCSLIKVPDIVVSLMS